MSIDAGARDTARNAFLRAAGWADATRHPLPGDASSRHYVRLVRPTGTAMLMDQPQNAETPAAPPEATAEERRALGYNALARLAGADCARFVAVARYLKARGLSVPDIYDADTAQGFLLIEDLGDGLYTGILADHGDEETLYAEAIDALALLHAEPAPAMLTEGKPLFVYDDAALLAETDLIVEWFLPLALGRPASAALAAEHRALWMRALAALNEGPRVFVHRDYHAQNLLWLPERKPPRRAGLIDFQDAVAGSPAYDLISLLEDARRNVPQDLAQRMTARYLDRSGAEPERFRAEAALLAAQRNAKIIGIFARLALRDRKPRYLAYLPRVWGHMDRDLAHPSLHGLKAWYDEIVPRAIRNAVPAEGGAA